MLMKTLRSHFGTTEQEIDLIDLQKIFQQSNSENKTVIKSTQGAKTELNYGEKAREEKNKIIGNFSKRSKISTLSKLGYENRTNFLPLKKLEGQVISISQERKEILIQFHEIGGNKQIVEEAVFDMEEISPSDYDLLEEGAIVYWNIGYLDRLGGRRQRISELFFRRMPIWSKKDIESVNKEAEVLKDFFSPESQNKKNHG